MKSVILALLLAVPAYAEEMSIAGPFVGLNNTDSSITLETGEAQDTINVEVSQDSLALKKRKGYSLISALEVATSPITGSIFFKTTSGDNVKLFGYDTKIVKSVNGGVFSTIYTTAPAGSHWSFCASNGKAYVFNSSTYSFTPFSYDGTSLTYYPSMPKASLCATTVDRMLLAGTTDFPNRLYFSRSGDLTDYVVNINPEDPGFEDIGLPGEKITNIFTTQSEWLVFKTNSFTSYQGSNQFDLLPSVISEKVGMIEPRAIVQHEGAVYFKSSDGKFYGYAAGTLNVLSKKIDGFVSGITRDATNTSEYTSKSQFDTGTYYASTGNVTAGSVEPYDYGFMDTTDSDFNLGEISGSSISVTGDAITINNFNSGTFPNMGAEMGDLTNWTGDIQIGGVVYYGAYSLKWTSGASAFSASINITDSKDNFLYGKRAVGEFVIDTSTFPTPIKISFGNEAGGTYSASGTSVLFNTPTSITYRISGSCVSNCSGKIISFDMPEITPVVTSATYISRVFTIPNIYNPKAYFVSSSSIPLAPSATQEDFFVKSSSSSTGPFTEWVPTTNYYLLGYTTNQYWQYKETIYNKSSYLKPITYSAGIVFKTTGYFETPEVVTSGMTSWGTFLANTTTDGLASWNYAIYTSSYAGGTALANAEPLTAGATITSSTGTYSKIRATNSFYSATETVRLDNLSYSWSRTPDKMANAFEYKGDIYFGVPYLNSLNNNRLLKFDINTGGWNIFDIAENSPLSIDEYVYFGSPTSGNIYQYPVGDSDNGNAINSYWKSKNFIGTNPYVEKKFNKMSLILASDYGSNLDVTYTMDTSTSTTYTIALTSTTADFVRNNRSLPFGDTGTFFNLQIGNNAANQPWSFYGANVEYTNEPWRVIPQE